MSKKDINTDGAAYIGGKINTGGGKIYPKDHVVYGDKVGGDKIRGDKITVTIGKNARNVVVGNGLSLNTHDEPTTPPDMSGLPDGAILSPDFVGGQMQRGDKYYRMMQPVTQRNGLFVYVPV